MFAQAPAKVDYATDIQPLLKQNCVGCHGPLKQNGGLRLDQRSSAMKAGSRRIVPTNSANSMLYHRVADGQFGPMMPPTGDLKPEQVALIQRWIEEGADWPDALANDAPLPPLDPGAVALVDMLHNGDLAGFMKTVTAKPALLNARGPEGSTPFMYAVLYAGAATTAKLLKLGADPKLHNDDHATALLWGVHDLAKATMLLAHGADVNARSDDFRTPLMIAARMPGGTPVVRLLLEHGADPNLNPHPEGQSSPLLEAATLGDGATFALLLEHGAKIKDDAEPIIMMSIQQHCPICLERTVAQVTDKHVYTSALTDTAFLGDVAATRLLLAHGADPKAYDGFGHTALMYSVGSDVLPLEAVKLLVEHGADVNARSRHGKSGDEGLTVLDMARRHGRTPLVDYLVAAGAKDTTAQQVVLHWRAGGDMRSTIQESIPQLQRADIAFAKNSGCVSCHNNSLTSMTVSVARKKNIPIDETTAAESVKVNADSLATSRDLLHQGFLIPLEDTFSENILGYMLIALGAEGFKPNLDTDATAMELMWRQKPNGEWPYPHADTRQPLCLDFVGQTALAMRALQLYAPKLTPNPEAYRLAVARAANWIAQAKSASNDDRSWRVTGLAWAGTHKLELRLAIKELVANQKSDGGWSDLPSMDSSAYATGKSLVALHDGGMAVSDPVYQRGVQWLMSHRADGAGSGTWFVQTRALAFQPWADAGFPHGYDQFISTAGTNWAAMALALALPGSRSGAGARGRLK
jgi:ankyrin repeat protein